MGGYTNPLLQVVRDSLARMVLAVHLKAHKLSLPIPSDTTLSQLSSLPLQAYSHFSFLFPLFYPLWGPHAPLQLVESLLIFQFDELEILSYPPSDVPGGN